MTKSDRSVKEGKTVTITRTDENSPHEVDRSDFQLHEVADSLLTIQTFDSVSAEHEWIARQVARDINIVGIDPSDILITGAYGKKDNDYCQDLKQALKRLGIAAYHAGEDRKQSVFRQDNCVTLSAYFSC